MQKPCLFHSGQSAYLIQKGFIARATVTRITPEGLYELKCHADGSLHVRGQSSVFKTPREAHRYLMEAERGATC